MISINRVMLLGRLTRDPDMRATQGGTSVAEFSLALNSREKKGDEWGDRVDYIDVVAFGERADACEARLAKGKMVAVEGRIRQERWETEGGEKRSRVRVVATNLDFIEGAGRRDGPPSDVAYAGVPDDDIPF
jgi:single-strand DNA-binding protein